MSWLCVLCNLMYHKCFNLEIVLCSNPSKRHIGGGKVLLEGDDRHKVLHKIYKSYNDDVGKVILNVVIFM